MLGCLLAGVVGQPHGEGAVPAVVGVPASSSLASRGSEKVCKARPGGRLPAVSVKVTGKLVRSALVAAMVAE